MRPDSQIQSLGIGQSHSRCLSFFKIPPHLGSLPSGSRAGSDGCDRGIAHLRTPVSEQQSSCATSRAPRARLALPAGLLPSEPGTHLAEQTRLRVSGIQRDLPPFLSPAARTHSTSVPAPGRGGRGSSPRGRLTGLARSKGMKIIVALLMYDERRACAARDALWRIWSRALGARGIRAPDSLDRSRSLNAVWRDPALLMGQTCSLPCVDTLEESARDFAVTQYSATGCGTA